jgi:hypothetical protein
MRMSAAQTTRGANPSGLPPETRGTEARASTIWAHYHPEPDDPYPAQK